MSFPTSVFTYFSLQHYVKRNPLGTGTLTISAIICAAGGGVFPAQLHLLTSLFTLAWLVWAQRNAKPFMADLWLAFFVLLVPFVISNGVLTGLSFWENPSSQRRCLHHRPNRLVPPGAQHGLAHLHDARR